MVEKIQRIGIFAGLRRRRWALSLAFGYALLLNALLGTSVEGSMAAAVSDPLAAAGVAALCSPAQPASDSPHHTPADHQQTCPLCGPACPMGGCAPLESGAASLAFAAPDAFTLTPLDRHPSDGIDGRSLYASDTDSQGPPAT